MGKSAPVDGSKSSFQSTFADAIGATVVGADKAEESQSPKAQGLDSKRMPNSDGKKKNKFPDIAVEPVAAQIAIGSTQLLPVEYPVPVSVVPQVLEGERTATMVHQSSERTSLRDPESTMSGNGNAGGIQLASAFAHSASAAINKSAAPLSHLAEGTSANTSEAQQTETRPMPAELSSPEVTPVSPIKTSDRSAREVSSAVDFKPRSEASPPVKAGINAVKAFLGTPLTTPLLSPVRVPQQVLSEVISDTSNAATATAGVAVPKPLAKTVSTSTTLSDLDGTSVPSNQAPDGTASKFAGTLEDMSHPKAVQAADLGVQRSSSITEAVRPSPEPLPIKAPLSIPQEAAIQITSTGSAVSDARSFKAPLEIRANTTAASADPATTVSEPVAKPISTLPVLTNHEAPSTATNDATDATASVTSGVDTASHFKAAPAAESGVQNAGATSDSTLITLLPTPTNVPQAVLQQAYVPDSNKISAVSTSLNFKVPSAKTGSMMPADTATVSAKGKAGSSRTYGTANTTDDKQTATDTDSDFGKVHVETPVVIVKEVSSGAGDVAQGSALAQSNQAAQTSGPSNSAQSIHVAPQTVSNAAPPAAPAQHASIENVQVAHTMSSAQLIQSARGSEMKLGMQSAEFGNISISTSLNRQALSAQISIDHSALGHALAAHLPAIEEKLGSAYCIQAKVELRDTGSNSAENGSSNGESKGNRQAPAGHTGLAGLSAALLQNSAGALTNLTYTSPTAGSSRLDIRI